MHRIPVGVLGASGYAGRELCTLIADHPGLDLIFATANERRGERMTLPSGSVTFVATDDAPLKQAEVVFSSLPHGASAEWVARARAAVRGGRSLLGPQADIPRNSFHTASPS
jgi:N-acetyl-gamma-glutamyl-phosphate reductase